MKVQLFALSVFLCLGAAAPGQTTGQTQNPKTTQSANRIKKPNLGGETAVVGCVDQQGNKYVLRNAKTDELLKLETTGNPDDSFARFVGHQVQVSGSESGGTLNVSHIGQVADMCGTGGK